MLASDAPLTHRAAIILENWLLAQRDEHPNRTFYHATFVDESFNTVDTEPVVPLTKIRKRVVRLISNAGLSGLVRIEVAPLVNHEASYGRPLLCHAHALVWTDDEFDHQGWSDRLNNSRHWNCSFGAIVLKKSASGAEITGCCFAQEAAGRLRRVAGALASG